VHLAGNHERQVLTGRPGQWNASDEFTHSQLNSRVLAWMGSLKPSVPLDRDVFLCHATPDSDIGYFLESVEVGHVRMATLEEVDERIGEVDASLILCGHTHVPRSVRSSKGNFIVNPGSVGLPAFYDTRPHPHVIQTGSPAARYAIVERMADGWKSELIAVPYAHMAMAKLAQDRMRDDWACALSSGFLSCEPLTSR